ncbi:MAG: 3-isopropylmalate dehydratase small subunit [Propionibacteriales bacterium]|nr:3-isopropylmalate dehydratase small subunit [Propionibacteriales bacterium]
MQQFTLHRGTALPLRRSNVDTDQIIPAVYLRRITRSGFEDGLFAAWRDDPDFVLNKPEYEGASVLLAAADFGTGSSREHAVWALRDYGFRVVVSPRFGDIFRANAGKQGLLAVQVDDDVIDRLWCVVEADPAVELHVDLTTRQIRCGDTTFAFQIDNYTRWRLLEGLDDIDITLAHEADIAGYEGNRPSYRPVTASLSQLLPVDSRHGGGSGGPS